VEREFVGYVLDNNTASYNIYSGGANAGPEMYFVFVFVEREGLFGDLAHPVHF
jgi:hypothetical protein